MHQGKAKKSLPQVFSQHQSTEDLKGKLQYSITIPQLGIVANGLLDKAEPVDWILLDYIRRWELNKRAQAITKDGKRLVRINFKHLLESLPILHYFKIHSKSPITRKLQKLEKLGVIETFKAKDNTLFARLTEKAWECYQTRLSKHTEDEISPPVPLREKQPVSHIEKYPVPPREEQHNRESIDNQNSKSFIKRKSYFNSIKKNKNENHSSNGNKNRENHDPSLTEEKIKQNLEIIRKAQEKLLQKTSFDEPKLESARLAELKDVQLDPIKKAEIEKELVWVHQKNLERDGKLYQ